MVPWLSDGRQCRWCALSATSWTCPARLSRAVWRIDTWRHEDETPCEGPDGHLDRLVTLRCGVELDRHWMVHLGLGHRLARTRYHCRQHCDRFRTCGERPVMSWTEAVRTPGMEACEACGHWRRGPMARWLATPAPRVRTCRPTGRLIFEWCWVPGHPALGLDLEAARRVHGVRFARRLETERKRWWLYNHAAPRVRYNRSH
jgi:hypothetical protein